MHVASDYPFRFWIKMLSLSILSIYCMYWEIVMRFGGFPVMRFNMVYIGFFIRWFGFGFCALSTYIYVSDVSFMLCEIMFIYWPLHVKRPRTRIGTESPGYVFVRSKNTLTSTLSLKALSITIVSCIIMSYYRSIHIITRNKSRIKWKENNKINRIK